MVDREKVALVREVIPPEQDVAEATDVFALLEDPNRLRLLPGVLEGDETCGCDLAGLTHAQNTTALHPEQHDVSTLAGADV